MKNHFIKVNDINVRYWQAGNKGPALILIHGLGGAAENWQYNIEALSQQYSVYVIDLPGFGQSDKPKRAYDLPFYQQTLIAFMDAMQLEKATLVGNSLGGGLALMMAIDYPYRVDNLILCAAAGFSRHLHSAFKLLTIRFINRLLLRPTLKKCHMGLFNLTVQHGFITPQFIKTQYQYNRSPGAVRAFLSVISHFASFNGVKRKFADKIEHNLHHLKMPILVIWGENDPLLPLAQARDNIAKLRHYKLITYRECGHLPQCEMAEKFNNDVMQFLQKHTT